MSTAHAHITPITQQTAKAATLEELVAERANYKADMEYITEQIERIDAALILRLGVGTHDVGDSKVQVREYTRTDYAALAEKYPAGEYPQLYKVEPTLDQAAVKAQFAPAALDEFKVTGKKSVTVK